MWLRWTAVAAAVLLAGLSCGDGGTEPERPSAASVVVSPATVEFAALGETAQLQAEVFDQNGHAMAGPAVAWSSSDAAVATVDRRSPVRGVGEGGTTITAAAGSARGTVGIAVTNTDRAALVALFEATGGPSWTSNDGWLASAPLSDWYGITIDADGRVTELDLRRNGFAGPNPAGDRRSRELGGPPPQRQYASLGHASA